MAIYRQVQTSFWQDVRVLEEMTPEDKLFYMYLMTNPQTRQIGVYQITKKTMAFELGYSMESVGSLLDRFEHHHGIIKYNPETREIAILNWGKYNLNKGGKPIEDCVKKELGEVKDIHLVRLVAERIKNERIRELFYEFLHKYESYDDTYVTHDDSFTTRGEKEKEEQQQEEKEKQEQQQKENRTPAVPKEMVVENKSIKFYAENFGMITSFIAQDILAWVDDLNDDLVVKAMQIALLQNTRNMSYVRSILKDWHLKGFKTIQDVEAAEAEFRRKQGLRNQSKSGFKRQEAIPEWLQPTHTATKPQNTMTDEEMEQLRKELEQYKKKDDLS